jgi:hypothetical protein
MSANACAPVAKPKPCCAPMMPAWCRASQHRIRRRTLRRRGQAQDGFTVRLLTGSLRVISGWIGQTNKSRSQRRHPISHHRHPRH